MLGEGGFGTVWLAERRQPMVQRVAIKIIKPGMDSAAVIARFEQERQALAVMDHPNVARVFDGGVTPTGRPYFVMEYVKGVPITGFCDRHRYTIRQRLELFVGVCEAVQHAHAKGIIHRDLKPSNILVEEIDGVPVVKVIDFGIAKAITQAEWANTAFTQEGMVIGTPEYMSPEQVLGVLDVDTRSDVYALGVVLYELLTGELPFDSLELRRAGLAEIQRIIREQAPPRPSTRLSGADPERRTSIARSRSIAGDRLSTELRRELDWIPLMALRKERDRRYASASALADDVCRYLDGRPLVAAPDSRMYLARKFVGRNRVQVVAAASVFAALSIGLVVALWQRNEAMSAQEAEAKETARADERAKAAEEAELAERQRADELKRVSDFQSRMLSEIDATKAGVDLMADIRSRHAAALESAGVPEADRNAMLEAFASELARVNATDTAAGIIDRTILRPAIQAIGKDFSDQPVVDAQLRQALADLYVRIGLYAEAMPLQESALSTRRREFGDADPRTLASINDSGAVLQMSGKTDEAEPLLLEALELRRSVLGEDHPDTIESIGNVATLRRAQTRFDEADAAYRDAIERSRRVLGNDHTDTLRLINNHAYLLEARGDYPAAELRYREALEGQRRVLGEESPLALVTMNNIAQLLRAQGKLGESEAFSREALERQQRVLGESHPNTLASLNNLGYVLYVQGKRDEADPLMTEALSRCRVVLGNDHPQTISVISNVGQLRFAQGRVAEAEPFFHEAAERSERVLGRTNSQTMMAKNNLGFLLQSMGKYSEAEPFMADAVALGIEILGERHLTTLTLIANYGMVLSRLERFDEAIDRVDDHEDAAREVFVGPRATGLASMLRTMGVSRVGLGYEAGRFTLAESNLLEGYSLYAALRGEAHKDTVECIQGLIALYTAWHAAEPDKGFEIKAREWQGKLDAANGPEGTEPRGSSRLPGGSRSGLESRAIS